MMHVTTTGAQLRISQEFLTRQTWYCNEEGKGEQVVVTAKGFHFTMGLKKVCPRNPELNLVVTCITPHASHNHLANTKKNSRQPNSRRQTSPRGGYKLIMLNMSVIIIFI